MSVVRIENGRPLHPAECRARATRQQLTGRPHTLSNGAVVKISGVPVDQIKDHDNGDQDQTLTTGHIELLDMVEVSDEALESISNTVLSDLSDSDKVKVIASLTRMALSQTSSIMRGERLNNARSRRIKELENALKAIDHHLKETALYADRFGMELPACFGAAQATLSAAFKANCLELEKLFR